MPSVAGRVNEALEARVRISLIGGQAGTMEVECVVDTGFNGALVLPASIVSQLGLPIISHEVFSMVGNEESSADVVLGQVDWLGEVRRVDVIVREDQLIGTALLDGTRLIVDYIAYTVDIDR
jgi:clan AA aspartic protease